MAVTKYYVREWRQIRRMSQDALAKKANLRRATVSDLERGKYEPREETVLTLMYALQLDEEQLKRDPYARFEQ